MWMTGGMCDVGGQGLTCLSLHVSVCTLSAVTTVQCSILYPVSV